MVSKEKKYSCEDVIENPSLSITVALSSLSKPRDVNR